MNITKNINELNYIYPKEKKEMIYIIYNNIEISLIAHKNIKEIIYIISNNLNICLFPDKNLSKLLYIKKLNVESNVNDINYECNKKSYFQNLLISSKNNEINITAIEKDFKIEICSNASEIIILSTKMQKGKIFKEEKVFFQIIKNKNISNKVIKTEKIILENYINTLNIGFDNNKKYDNYNIINHEKDEDSDNENDKLECEPILYIQKSNKNSQKN